MSELIERPMTLIERASKALSKAEVEANIEAMVEQSKSIGAVTDRASRDICHDSLMELANLRIRTQKAAKEGRDEAVQYSKTVIAIEKELVALISPEENRLAKLRDEWDSIAKREREAKVAAELARVTEIQRRIEGIRGWPIHASTQGSLLVGQMLAQADTYVIDPAVFEEFTQQATDALMVSRAALTSLLAASKEREAEQDRIKAEREELAKLRAEQIQREKSKDAERKRLAAIAQAERDAEHARQVAEAREHAQKLAEERRENERIAAIRQAELDRQGEAQRRALADETAALAAQRDAFEKEQAAPRKEQEPKPKKRSARHPSEQEIIEVLAAHYSATPETVRGWLSLYQWKNEVAA